MTLTVVILTKNEERHIRRALKSVSGIPGRCVVVDSGSVDRTVQLAKTDGARILVHPFVTQAQQFNRARDQLPSDTNQVLRPDADEIVTETVAQQIKEAIPKLGPVTKAGLRLTAHAFPGPSHSVVWALSDPGTEGLAAWRGAVRRSVDKRTHSRRWRHGRSLRRDQRQQCQFADLVDGKTHSLRVARGR